MSGREAMKLLAAYLGGASFTVLVCDAAAILGRPATMADVYADLVALGCSLLLAAALWATRERAPLGEGPTP